MILVQNQYKYIFFVLESISKLMILSHNRYKHIDFLNKAILKEYQILATRPWLTDLGYQILATRPQDPGCQILATRS